MPVIIQGNKYKSERRCIHQKIVGVVHQYRGGKNKKWYICRPEIAFKVFPAKLKQDKYPGAIAIKIRPKYIHAGNDEKVLEELARAKKYVDKYFTKAQATEEAEEKPAEEVEGKEEVEEKEE